jgi:hypothetical protein
MGIDSALAAGNCPAGDLGDRKRITSAFPYRPKTRVSAWAHDDPTAHEGSCPAAAEFLAKLPPNSDLVAVNHLQFFLLCLAGWVNRNQQNAIEYLQEEVKVLK